MKIIEKINGFVGRYMAVIVLLLAALALFMPSSSLWVQTKWINPLLMIVMFGMGLSLSTDDLGYVVKHPKYIIIGCIAQFTIMPLTAFLLGKAFGLETALLAGVILVGTCPGGTASNVITYLSKGDVALSVGMTSVNTLLAPLLTPAITYLFLHTGIHVDVLSMFLSIIQVVIIPIGLGLLINKLFGKFTEKAAKLLPVLSVMAICLIVMSVVSHNSEKILTCGAVILAVVVLHNIIGYALGFALGKMLKLPMPQAKALSVEIGMQNSGLAASLAGTAFPELAMATVPGAVFSVWHNISGAILANIFNRLDEKKTDSGIETK